VSGPVTSWSKLILEAAGTSLENICTTPLTNQEDLATYSKQHATHFTTHNPARTTVEVMLSSPELLFEIMVMACIPMKPFRRASAHSAHGH
jgi:enamine deaminase RidA (YjgF/YER057c/UK114 family)